MATGLSWLGRWVGVLSGLLLTPILFRTISPEELGLWFLIAGSQPLLSLMGFGVAAVFTRHVAMAQGQPAGGASPGGPDLDPDVVVGTGRRLLRGAAVVIGVVGFAIGAAAFQWLDLHSVSRGHATLAWGLYLAGYTATVWVSYLDCLVIGTGRAGVSAAIQLATAVVQVAAGATVALCGGGLIGLAGVNLTTVLLQRGLFLWVIRTRYPDLRTQTGRFAWGYARRLLRTAGLGWLNALGVFVVMQSAAYFVVALTSVGELPKYQAASSLAHIPYQLAIGASGAAAVFVSRAWRGGDRDTARRLTLQTAGFGMTLVAAGHGFVLVAGEEFIRLWAGEGRFIGYPVLVALTALFTLECLQYVLSTAGRATDDESFTTPVLIAAVLAPVFILTLSRWIGVFAVPVGMLTAQTLTVNWYTVKRTVTRLRIGWGAFARQVVAPWAGVFAGVLATAGVVTWVARANVPPGPVRDAGVVAAAAVAGGVALAVAHRHRLSVRQLTRRLRPRHPLTP